MAIMLASNLHVEVMKLRRKRIQKRNLVLDSQNQINIKQRLMIWESWNVLHIQLEEVLTVMVKILS